MHDKRHGNCTYDYFDGSCFEGVFIDDKRGKGLLKKNSVVVTVDEKGEVQTEDEKINVSKTHIESIANLEPKELEEVDKYKKEEQKMEGKIKLDREEHLNNSHSQFDNSQSQFHFENSQFQFEHSQIVSEYNEIKSEARTMDIGFETLSLIDQIEMMNCLNPLLLNKPSKFI